MLKNVIDVLEGFRGNEVTSIDDFKIYLSEEDKEHLNTLTNIDDVMESLECWGYVKRVSADNTYNSGSRLSNDINVVKYYSAENNVYLYQIMVHLYGDIRANYSDSFLLQYDDDYSFFEDLANVSISLDIILNEKKYIGYINVLDEGFEVDDEKGDTIGTVYSIGMSEILTELKRIVEDKK